jgi:hypothetical protein
MVILALPEKVRGAVALDNLGIVLLSNGPASYIQQLDFEIRPHNGVCTTTIHK